MTERATDVLVLGAGVIGLTTAVCLAEDGLAVTIRTGHLPAQTTSAVAGAIWGPHLVEDSDRVRRWCAETLDVLAGLAGEPAAGIRLVRGTEAVRSPAARPDQAGLLAVFGPVSPADPDGLPAGFAAGWRYTAPVVCMPVYLDYLLGRFRRAGGEIQVDPVATLAQAATETGAPVIVNCTGSGAHRLVPDPSLTPVRGQVVIVENPGITEFFIGHPDAAHEISYVFPHPGRVVLGGTEVSGDWSTEPRPETAQRILRDCAAIDPRLAGGRILEHRAGLRPVRPQVRLEAGTAPGPAGRLLVHNYGHGGGGVSLSWGCARAAARLAGPPA